MVAVVLNTEGLLDELGHPCRRPDVSTVALGLRAFEQELDEPFSLAMGQAGRPAWGRAHPEPLVTFLVTLVTPPHH